MNRLTSFLALITLFSLALQPNPGHSSDHDIGEKSEQKWYRVEVIIFTQKDVFGDELSSRDIVMTYPDKLIDLDNNSAGFTALPDSERELGPDVYSLNRTGVYEVLFHKAWQQPGLAPTDAPWLNINVDDKDTVLNGSLRVYLSSYLHLESNLWHINYASNLDTLSTEQPTLEPPSTAITDTDVLSNTLDAELSYPKLTPWPTPPAQPLTLFATLTLNTDLAKITLTDTPLLEAGLVETVINNQADLTAEENNLLNPVQRDINEIILLKQASRLTLDKLYYFDHPKMGLLVKVSRDTPAIIELLEKVNTIEEAVDQNSTDQQSSAPPQ